MIQPEVFRKWEKKLPKLSLIDRDSYIISRCKNRRVAHLGACDSPMTLGKAARGELLHQKLQGHCKSLIGYDIDAEAVTHLRNQFGLQDIIVRDLSDVSDTEAPSNDVVICADIIEHVDNVGNLLIACNGMLPVDGSLVLSTINAQSLKQGIRGLFGREPVHPDHVAYYSFSTLGVVLDRFGFAMEACRYFKYPTVGRVSKFAFDAIYAIAPQVADGVLVEATKKRNA